MRRIERLALSLEHYDYSAEAINSAANAELTNRMVDIRLANPGIDEISTMYKGQFWHDFESGGFVPIRHPTDFVASLQVNIQITNIIFFSLRFTYEVCSM